METHYHSCTISSIIQNFVFGTILWPLSHPPHLLMSSALNPPSHMRRSHRNRRCPPFHPRRRASSARAENTAAATSPPLPPRIPTTSIKLLQPVHPPPHPPPRSSSPSFTTFFAVRGPGPRAHPISLFGPPAAPRQGASALLWSLYLPCHPLPACLRFVAVVTAGHSSPPLPPECWVDDGTSKRAPPCFPDQVHGFTPSPVDC
jgi:hypothetical protein